MFIRIAVYNHCQMNENPSSNQEIPVLFEHGSEPEKILKTSPALFAGRYIPKALRTRLIISPMLLFAKTLRTVMTL